MILEIRLSNFYSINEEVVLDLRAGNINTNLVKNELAHNTIDYKKDKVLKTVGIYGANASGKSNIIRAIRECCTIVYKSHNYNNDYKFPITPFKFNQELKPSSFFISFVIDEIQYDYGFSLLDNEILTEELYYYPKGKKANIFSRDESAGKSKKDIYSFTALIKKPHDVTLNTSKKTLFISRASQMDRDITKIVYNFFVEQFILGYVNLEVGYINQCLKQHKSDVLAMLNAADSDIVDFSCEKVVTPKKHFNIIMNDDAPQVVEKSEIQEEQLELKFYHRFNPKVPFSLNEESAGTRKLFNVILRLISVLENNKTLLIDELEENFHPLITQMILDLFHNSQQSQLIYSTHDTNLLDLTKLRKDQIYFVQKQEDGSSDLYSLYDYKDFRESMNVEKAYLQGRFDAIPKVNL